MVDEEAGATAELASPIKRRPTPLVDILPRPRLLLRKQKPAPSKPQPEFQPAQDQSANRESVPVSSVAKWGRSLTAKEDLDTADTESYGHSAAEVFAPAASRAAMFLTVFALAAVLLTIAFFVTRSTVEPDEVPDWADRIAVEEVPEPIAPRKPDVAREPVEFAELLHRDASPQSDSE